MSTETIDNTAGAAETQVESIWLTRGSNKPVWLAFTLLLVLIGLFAFWPLLVAAGATFVIIALSWISEARHESDELPLD